MKLENSYLKIIFIAPIIYFLYGLCRSFFLDVPFILTAHTFTMIFSYAIGITYSQVDWFHQKFNVQKVLMSYYVLTHANEQVLAYFNGYVATDLVSIGILSIAITFTFWMQTFKENLLTYIIGLASMCSVIYISDVPKYKASLMISFFLLFFWKFVNDVFIKKYNIAFEKDNKLKAYKETVGLLNHEFNNVSSIALMLIKRLKKNNDINKEEEELEKVLYKVTELIKSLHESNEYESEEYTQGVKITKLNNQSPPQD